MISLLLALLIEFSWSANVPADNVTGYKLKIGPGDGTYPVVVDVGNVLKKSMPDDTLYRAAVVTAYNSQGIESAPSQVLIYRPKSPVQPSVAVVPAN